MDKATISTMESLRYLGFQPDPTIVSDGGSGLSFDFGNFVIRASCCLNLRCKEIILLAGVLSTRQTVSDVQIEMPRQVESIKQCAALIVWSLDQHSQDRVFKPTRNVRWVEEGRENRKLLPWVMSAAEYDARPHCTVKRDWLRLALKTLGAYLPFLPDDAYVVFSFDGSVLSIRCDGRVIALAGEGPPWAVRFKVAASVLRRLPKRLMRENVGVSVWESRLSLGHWTYPGTIEGFSITDSSRIQ
jgi:hypothetical protein